MGTLARTQFGSAELVLFPPCLSCPLGRWSHLLPHPQVDLGLERPQISVGAGREGGRGINA